MVRATCLAFVCQGASAVAEALAQRELRFRRLAGVEAGAFAAGFIVAGPVLAWRGAGVWALVGALLTQQRAAHRRAARAPAPPEAAPARAARGPRAALLRRRPHARQARQLPGRPGRQPRRRLLARPPGAGPVHARLPAHDVPGRPPRPGAGPGAVPDHGAGPARAGPAGAGLPERRRGLRAARHAGERRPGDPRPRDRARPARAGLGRGRRPVPDPRARDAVPHQLQARGLGGPGDRRRLRPGVAAGRLRARGRRSAPGSGSAGASPAWRWACSRRSPPTSP